MCISPVLQTLQLSCGRTPLIFAKHSNIEGVGFVLKNLTVYTSTLTALSNLLTSFIVPVTTTSSSSFMVGTNTGSQVISGWVSEILIRVVCVWYPNKFTCTV